MGRKTTVLRFSVAPEIAKEYEQLASRQRKTKSELFRQMVEAYKAKLEEEEFFRIIEYIERNPVSAGLTARPEKWPWSSARWRSAWKPGEAFRLEFAPADEPQRLLAAWRSYVRQAKA